MAVELPYVYYVIGSVAGLLAIGEATRRVVYSRIQGSSATEQKGATKLSWSKIEGGILDIISKLRSDNFTPDVVLAIGRSGAILGGLIAGNMKGLPLALLDRKFSWDKDVREYVQSGFTDVHIGADCKNVLIVVGEVYSGQTLVECLKRLEPVLVSKEVRTCTLVKSKTSTCDVNYYAYEVDKIVRPAWVITSEYIRYESPTRRVSGH